MKTYKNKIERVAKFILKNYDGFQRFYTPSMFGGEISDTDEVCGIQIDASRYYEYVDILGLTDDEKNELEVKLTELEKQKR